MANYPYKAVQAVDLQVVMEALGGRRDVRNSRLWRHKDFYVHDEGGGHFYDMNNKALGFGAVQLVCSAASSTARAAEVWLSKLLSGIDPDLKRQELAQYAPRLKTKMDSAGVATKTTLRELCVEAESRYAIPAQMWMRAVQRGFLSFPTEGDRLIFLRRDQNGVADGGEVLPVTGSQNHYPLLDRPRLKSVGSRLGMQSFFYQESLLGCYGPVGVFPNALEAMSFAALNPRFSVMSVGDTINVAATNYFLKSIGRKHSKIEFWMPDNRAGNDGAEILTRRLGLKPIKSGYRLAHISWVEQMEQTVKSAGGIHEFMKRRNAFMERNKSKSRLATVDECDGFALDPLR